jgi:hypothetical protein
MSSETGVSQRDSNVSEPLQCAAGIAAQADI